MLLNYLEAHLLKHPTGKDTANQYRRAIRCYGRFLGHVAGVADLNADRVNCWLSKVSETRSPDTVRLRKRGICRVWNILADQHLVPRYDPQAIRHVAIPRKPPMPWSIATVETLLAAADSFRPKKMRCGTDIAQLLRCLVLVGYETGLRPGDVRGLGVESIRETTITIVQNKTGNVHVCEISSQTAEDCEQLISQSGKLFEYPKGTLRRWETRLIETARGMGAPIRQRSGLGMLRKVGATEVAKTHGIEEAAKFLGHVSGTGIARRHYVAPHAFGTPARPPHIAGRRFGCHRQRT